MDIPQQAMLNQYKNIKTLEEMIGFLDRIVPALVKWPAHQLEMRAIVTRFRNLRTP